MKKLFLLFMTVLFCQVVHAQSISGTIKGVTNNPIEYATVLLLELPDTTYVDGAITDAKGVFQFNPSSKKELLMQISFIGYKTLYLPAISGQTIVLENDPLLLDEFVVKGSRPISKLTTGGVVTSIQNTILSKIGTGNDVLKRLPLLSGTAGEFEVFGRGKAKIYIDNREVRDPAELDNLNSTDIRNVEVITSPGAKYDATVPAIIHIKTIRKQGDGFSFNARSSVYGSKTSDYVEQLHINYRKKRVDIFGSLYYSNTATRQTGDIVQHVYIDTLWSQKNTTDALLKGNKLNGTIGANYEIDENHVVGLRYDVKTTPKKNRLTLDFNSDVMANGVPYDTWENKENRLITNRPTSQVNLYYAGVVEKLKIDFNSDYYGGRSFTNTTLNETSEAFGNRILYSTSGLNNALLSAKLQLSYPVWKGSLSVGSEYIDIHRIDDYENEDLPEFSSNVDINETNIAYFADYQLNSKIGAFNVGVRYEYINSLYAVDNVLSEDKSREYKQWFPNLSYSTKIKDVALQLSYSTKVQRPTYRQLSNNLSYGNRFTMETGNPYLYPSINRELAFMGVWDFLQVMVSYKQMKDAIVLSIDQLEKDPKVSVMSYTNIDNLPSLSAYVTLAPKFGIWKPQLSGGIEKQWFSTYTNGSEIVLNKPIFKASLNNSFALPMGIAVTLDGAYTSTGDSENAYMSEDSYVVDFGIMKGFLNESLQVKFEVYDVFSQTVNAAKIYNSQMDFSTLYVRDSREFAVSLRYYFNSSRSKYRGRSSSDSAVRRL